MLKSLLFSMVFLLGACSSLPTVQQLPAQAQAIRTFKVEQQGQQSLLSVQFQAEQWRWVQTDPFGAPIARLLLTQAGWQQDGFVMPNRQAQQLFSVLANGLNPKQPPFRLDDTYQLKSDPPRYWIKLPDESEWNIEELAL